jgi:transposase
VLLSADGWSNRAIGIEVGLHYNQVAVWRDRFREEGLAGLVDTDRPGPPVYDANDVNPTRPARPATATRPARAARRQFEYRRHGTAVLYAGLKVHDGDVTAWVTDPTRADNFITFLGDLVAATPAGLQLRCIVDNLSAHGTAFLDDLAHHHVFLHRTPTHASWLNQIELFFSILQRRLLRYGEFDSVEDLVQRADRIPLTHRLLASSVASGGLCWWVRCAGRAPVVGQFVHAPAYSRRPTTHA